MGDLQLEKGSGAKPRAVFYSDGVATDLDGACTATVTRPDGTQITGSPFTASHVNPTGSGTYEFTLPQQTEVIAYDVTWAGAIGGVATSVTTHIEVVGIFLYTLAAMRAVKVAGGTPFTDTAAFPNQTLLDRRAEVTLDFEARTGYSFVPRFAREVLDGDGTDALMLRQLRCSKLLSVTIDGTAQSVGDFTLASSGVLSWKMGGWFSTAQRQNVVVEYRYGWDQSPPAVSTVALLRTAMLLQPSQFAGAVTVTTPDGASYSYSQAGQSFQGGGTRHYGWPDIDACLNSPSYNALGAAFA